ncbi:hypothetical protein Kpol_530p5 [Vanderwaltozyma polyspora DSM 70294]|uniref:Uncharacterized protein n=1 Tax=Vanderwaltozyma polyspora (strain ATCC 22028 / DSM 70294 / BCRC 21397 / CBS 2163 / NBRC 10782 / NRRL Y-8283 / UCD 57-17) TaxID=436907 RepID=A7TKY0_VANPO|nr:uncharacterized protein Kpol_530p5 [Vanderwaltozyma polyspora DSM 70294]EDO17036.1 hypothetical protein Kpol_530p5 [Vanderwaltozyma polyspora DSM 70294]
MSCKETLWPEISELTGTVSFLASFVSLMPQIIETYRDKTVEGLSPYFLLAWLLGDITSIIGATLTNQLTFQILLAIYFLANDLVVCLQYYYYGVLHENKLATVSHESKPILASSDILQDGDSENIDTDSLFQRIRTNGSERSRIMAASALLLSTQVSAAEAFPFFSQDSNTSIAPIPIPGKGPHDHEIGVLMSWLGAFFYVGARLPQLIKNYRRKSTDGISPTLFAMTLLSNITYNISIFTSCNFFDSDDKHEFIMNAMPFIFGSAGTVAFDMIYFYQHYVLYSSDMKLRELERELFNEDLIQGESETSPLLQQDQQQ